MELVAGAGNVQKLFYAYSYGADAVYIGLEHFSLRAKADNFGADDVEKVIALKKQFPDRRLYCALNMIFEDKEIDELLGKLDLFQQFPFDAFIIQDLGLVDIIKKNFPKAALHLSTQASCLNARSAAFYKTLGFSRIILGREASLADIRRIKDECDIELEAFCHGAMCIAYSGRCLMSAYLTGRSGQKGLCTHSCRWDYDIFLREHERGELLPVEISCEGDGARWTQILSSKDLCMIEHLKDMKSAGLDAIKIEGRMKSLYYIALVTQGYRAALKALDEGGSCEYNPFVNEVFHTAHREWTTGFYYDKSEADKVTRGATKSDYDFCAIITKELTAPSPWVHAYALESFNMIRAGDELEIITSGDAPLPLSSEEYSIFSMKDGVVDFSSAPLEWVCDGHPAALAVRISLKADAMIRKKRIVQQC